MAQIVTEDDFIKFIREALSKDRHAVAIFLSLESLRKFPENIILQEIGRVLLKPGEYRDVIET